MISIKLVNVLSKCFLMQYYWKENGYKIKRDKKITKKHLQMEKYEAERYDFIGR